MNQSSQEKLSLQGKKEKLWMCTKHFLIQESRIYLLLRNLFLHLNQYYIENVQHDFEKNSCPLKNDNYTKIVVRKNCDSFNGLKKPSTSEIITGSFEKL